MTDRSVQFEKLKLHRVDKHIRRGEGFELVQLSPGVTLIHGPNGSGKSTTALAIQELLWPGRTGLERPSIEGWFHNDTDYWHVDIDAGHVECARDGTLGAMPELGPPENRCRYRLALHELIQEDSAEFATVIANASQGGYDLAAATDAMGFRSRPKSRSAERRGLQERRADVDAARQHQRAVEEDAAKLKNLRNEREQATVAERNIDLLQKAEDHRQAEERCREIKVELDALPDGIARLRGDERENLDRLTTRREQLESELGSERQCIERAESELSELKLPDEGVDKEILSRLRGWHHRLSEVESDIRQQRQQMSEAEAEAECARRKLGEHLTDEQLASIETVEVGELSSFARRADRVCAREGVIEERRRQLDREKCEEVQDLDEQQIRDGLAALGRWLASPTPTAKPATRLGWPIVVGATLIVVLGVVLAMVHHWAWALSVLPAVGLVATDWWLRRPAGDSAAVDPRAVHRQSYEETGLQLPQAWEVETITDQVRRLVQLAGFRAQEDDRLRRLEDLNAEVEALGQQKDELNANRRSLQERLGVNIVIADEWLPLLVDNIGLWQRHSIRAAGAKKALGDLEHEQKTLLGRINDALSPFGYNEVDSAEIAAQSIEDLRDRQSRHLNAVSGLAQAQRRICGTVEPVLRDVAEQRRAIFQRLGIDESDEPTIDDWLAERPAYLERNKELSQAEAIRHDRRQALADHEHLLVLDFVDIQQQIDEQRIIAAKRDALSEQIAGIERDIETAKAGHELSDALEACDAAKAALTDARVENGAAVIGALLAKWVRTVAIERSRPDVFRRANEFLVKFTHGTLHLSLDDHADPPTFQARRGSEPPRPVDELSTGERVQLLMAVRIAFLEQDELVRLPLLVDEALGNSDDARAGVIIDSVIEIAREGRQVFYFTSQRDEVGKWVARLESAGVANKVIDLANVRGLAAAHTTPLQIASIEMPEPLAPGGMNHDDYGRALNVPGLDPAAENLDGLHLWHVLDDADQLYRLLSQHIVTWGQLCTLVEHGGAGLLEVGDGTFDRAAIAARAIEAACQVWCTGRGKPVDRAALQDSGCVTDSFIQDVSSLAERLCGDAQAIITALEEGQVSRWRTRNTDGLREYFEENGFLSPETPVSAEQIRVRVMAAVANDLRAGRISQAIIDRIVGSLPM